MGPMNTPSVDRAGSLKQLAARALAGDDEAFEELHRRLGGGLRKFIARRVGDDEERVEELAQEAWVAAWQSLRRGSYDPEQAAFSTFLYAIGMKMVLRSRRSQARTSGWTSLDAALSELLPGPAEDPHAALELARRVDCLRRALADQTLFSEEERRLLEGLAAGRTERELAVELNWAPSTAHTHKKRVLSRLRRHLESQGC